MLGLYASPVFASYSQLASSTLGTASVSNPAQSVSDISGVFQSFSLKKDGSGGASLYRLFIYEYPSMPSAWGGFSQSWSSDTTKSSNGIGVDTWLASDFSSTITFDSSKVYVFMFYQLMSKPYGSASDVVSGQYWPTNGNTTWSGDGGLSDIYYVVVTDDMPPSLTLNSSPTSTQIRYYNVSYDFSTSTEGVMKVYTRRQGGTGATFVVWNYGVSQMWSGTGSVSLYSPNTLEANVAYESYASFEQNGIEIASSSLWQYTMGNDVRAGGLSLVSPPWYQASATSTPFGLATSTWFVDCSNLGTASSSYDNTWGALLSCNLKKGFMSTVGFFVEPHDSVTLYFTDSFQSLKTAFPFSLVYAYEKAVETAVSSTSTNTGLSFNYGVGTPYEFHGSVLSANMLENMLGSTSTQAIFTAETWAIWIGAGMTMLAMIL